MARNPPEYVLVPAEELKKLEEARVALYKYLPGLYTSKMEFMNITSQIWAVANTKIWER